MIRMRTVRKEERPLQLQRTLYSLPGLHQLSSRAIRQCDEAAVRNTPRPYLSSLSETQVKCPGIAEGSKKGWLVRVSYAFLILFFLTTVLVISSKRFLSESVIWLAACRSRSKARRPLPRDAQSRVPFWEIFFVGGSSCPS